MIFTVSLVNEAVTLKYSNLFSHISKEALRHLAQRTSRKSAYLRTYKFLLLEDKYRGIWKHATYTQPPFRNSSRIDKCIIYQGFDIPERCLNYESSAPSGKGKSTKCQHSTFLFLTLSSSIYFLRVLANIPSPCLLTCGCNRRLSPYACVFHPVRLQLSMVLLNTSFVLGATPPAKYHVSCEAISTSTRVIERPVVAMEVNVVIIRSHFTRPRELCEGCRFDLMGSLRRHPRRSSNKVSLAPPYLLPSISPDPPPSKSSSALQKGGQQSRYARP
eukprot:284815235_5